MYTVIRNYPAAPKLADELLKNKQSIETEIGSVQGFIAYYLIKTAEGATSVTVCENRAGCDESSKRAANWLTKNLPNLKVSPPQVMAGDVVFKFATYPTRV